MTLDVAAARALAELDAFVSVPTWDEIRARLRREPAGEPIDIARRVVAGVLRDLRGGRLERVV